MNSFPPFPHFTHHLLHCDVLVAGGGPAGVPAAIAAARAGADVILCHDRPMFGGNASSEVRMHIVGANHQRPACDLVLEPRETGIIEEIRLENAVRNPQCSASVFDLLLYEKCRAEPNLRFLLNTSICGATVVDGEIREAHGLRLSTEDAYTIKARTFVDATGDSGLGVAAGAQFVHGREGKAAYGEALATEQADGGTLGSTLLFMGKKHDEPQPYVAPPWVRRFTKDDFQHRAAFLSRKEPSYEYGYWWLEWGGHLDTIKENELIRDELLAILLGVWNYIKNEGDHGADNWALDWVGVLPGKRESRRHLGQYVLSEHDLLHATIFPDAIAYGGWPIDIHPIRGIDENGVAPAVQTPVPYLYEIPLRACVSANISNLLFAGRNISASHVAFASTRVMATCALVGEGVGVAAAYAVRHEVAPASLAENPAIMEAVRRHLVQQDVFLIGERDQSPLDKAQSATITASSEQCDGPASNVISGQNRSVQGERGVRLERLLPGTHRWMSQPAEGLPASLTLQWQEPVEIERLEITFDSGLHRHLTLTHSQRYFEKMHWGSGQPELVKDFSVALQTADGWVEEAPVSGHWQRRYAHQWETPQSVTALKITVHATWAVDHARIIRVAAF